MSHSPPTVLCHLSSSVSLLIIVLFLSCVWLFATLWTASPQASLSFMISYSLLKLMSTELMMPSNHLILLPPSPPALNPSQHQNLFPMLAFCIRWPKYWSFSFSFSISPSNEYSGLISFRIDWFDLLPVQGSLKSLSNTTVQTINF